MQGQTVTVAATLVGGGAELVWVDPLPDPRRPGTRPADGGDVYGDVQVAAVFAGAAGGSDGVRATCVAGVVTAPTVSLPEDPTGVDYAVTSPVDGILVMARRTSGDGDGDGERRVPLGDVDGSVAAGVDAGDGAVDDDVAGGDV